MEPDLGRRGSLAYLWVTRWTKIIVARRGGGRCRAELIGTVGNGRGGDGGCDVGCLSGTRSCWFGGRWWLRVQKGLRLSNLINRRGDPRWL